jgi:anhydro-N-acetylmuramic acid kinase
LITQARVFFNKPYDLQGAIAVSGQINEQLLGKLLQHPFLHRQPPRSAWRLDFGSSVADEILAAHKGLKPEDLLATFTEFTAATISKSSADHVRQVVSAKGIT